MKIYPAPKRNEFVVVFIKMRLVKTRENKTWKIYKCKKFAGEIDPDFFAVQDGKMKT